MGSFRLVIFDNDGVLVDSEPLAAEAMSEVLTSLGLALSPEQCDALFRGSALQRTRALAEDRFGGPLPAGFEGLYSARLIELMQARLRPVHGVEAVLDQLDAAGIAYCVASSGRRQRIGFALETAGLAQRFAGRWWGEEDAPEGKPAPDLFQKAAAEMGVEPGDCVVIEDSKVGVQAARTAGMAVFGFAAATPPESLAGAERIFTDMTELPALLLGGWRPDGPNAGLNDAERE